LACEARRASRRRHAHEAHAADARRGSSDGRHAHASVGMPLTPDPLAQVTAKEMFVVLDEELARLPDRYRAPLVCCLEGQSGEQAARNLGIPLRTFRLRLRQARELLRKRLNRRGYGVSGAMLSALLLRNMASAAVPPTLAADTAKLMGMIAAGKA